MKQSKKNRYKSIGKTPGTIIYTGEKKLANTPINVIDYTEESFQEIELDEIEKCFSFKKTDSTTWININELSNVEMIKSVGQHYDLHPLILEDIVNPHQRPKIEEYDGYIFVAFKMLYYNTQNELVVEHISLVLGKNYVLSFQEAEGDVFDSIRERLRTKKGLVRSSRADYLLYALMDAVVDNYFLIIETLGEKIEDIESGLFGQNNPDTVKNIQDLKKEALKIRRSIFPLREVVSKLEKAEHKLIEDKSQNYFRDLYDHTIQVIETIEIYRDMLWGLMDMYMSTVSNKMNEIMKVLTIMSAVFIPLTFLAGIYGMNFEYIPELKFKYGYQTLLAIMFLVFILMLAYFKRKKWF